MPHPPRPLAQHAHSAFLAWRANREGSQFLVESDVAGHAESLGHGRICLFAHFDPDGRVAPYVLTSLQALREIGFDIVFCSASPGLDGDAMQALSARCMRIIHRKNVGLDFGSWKVAFDQLGPHLLDNATEILLTNDSVFGPFGSLAGVYAAMQDKHVDVWGLTESQEKTYHLQSYFLHFSRRALSTRFLQAFFSQYRFQWHKTAIIRSGELSITRLAVTRGLEVASFVSHTALPDARNPTLFHWDVLIREHGFPFVKTSLLRDNIYAHPMASHWREVVGSRFPAYPPALIAAQLARTRAVVA